MEWYVPYSVLIELAQLNNSNLYKNTNVEFSNEVQSL